MKLFGTHVALEPLQVAHAAKLWPDADDPAIARWWPRRWQSQEDLESQFQYLLDDPSTEPFLVRHRASGRVAGSTSFYDVQEAHRHGSIGWTLYTRDFRRSAVNTEAKLLMLEEAFDVRGWERVQFDVDGRNHVSQDAVLRLGATREGVLRRNKVLHDGFIRDTHVFGILQAEWPKVKAALQARLQSGPA